MAAIERPWVAMSMNPAYKPVPMWRPSLAAGWSASRSSRYCMSCSDGFRRLKAPPFSTLASRHSLKSRKNGVLLSVNAGSMASAHLARRVGRISRARALAAALVGAAAMAARDACSLASSSGFRTTSPEDRMRTGSLSLPPSCKYFSSERSGTLVNDQSPFIWSSRMVSASFGVTPSRSTRF